MLIWTKMKISIRSEKREEEKNRETNRSYILNNT